ncbi:transmembrane protein [Paramyrothecium foliicola]|nr:transmembrane protein [Paramyrothecium foliicola]
MKRPMDIYDRIAIATIVIYTFFLCGGLYLSIKHGFRKSSGWRFLIILSLARLIGSSLRLATVNDPTNESLYIGWMVLNGLGLGPLATLLLALLARVLNAIFSNRNGNFLYKPRFQHLWEIAMLVGLILLIVGGTQSSFTVVNSEPKVQYSNLSEAGIGIFIGITGILCILLALTWLNLKYIDRGERRILVAVAVATPFLIVRLVYACLELWAGDSANRWMYLGMFVIMEMIVVLICQVLGFTLGVSKTRTKSHGQEHHVQESQWRTGQFGNVVYNRQNSDDGPKP